MTHACPFRDRLHASPLRYGLAGPQRGSLGAIIGSFKSAVTREARLRRLHDASPLWQRNYYERVVRNADELLYIREYIIANPSMWNRDPENPLRVAAPDYDEPWSWLEHP
jgi:putative transposase